MSKQQTTAAPEVRTWQGYCPQVAMAMVPAEARVARVFRAIYGPNNRACLDILADRSGDFGDLPSRVALTKWLRRNARRIQRHVWKESLAVSSYETVTYADGGGVFQGTPNGSYGYMYCAAWLVPAAN